MTRKNAVALFFLLGISFLLSLRFSPPYDLMRDDREVFSYAGMAILKGQVPYRDFFDHKPPGIFFINAAGSLLGGAWGLWTINTLLALMATWLLYRTCLQYRLAFPWLLPFLFNLMIRDDLISKGAGMTREYTTFFFVLFFCLFMGRSRFRELLLGFFTGLIFFTQQEQALAVLPFVLYVLVTERSRSAYLSLARIGLGFGVVLLSVLVYFAWNHSLGYLWDDAFRFNMVWYAQPKSLGDHFRTIKRSLDAGNYEMPFMIALVLGITAFFFRHKKKGLLLAALAAFFLSLAPEMMGGRFDDRANPIDSLPYFLPLAGSVCALLFVIFAFSDEAILGNRTVLLPFVVLLCCGLTYTSLQHSTHLVRRSDDRDINSPVLNYLRGHRPGGDYDLYVFNYDDYIYAYNEFRILAPSRWIYHHMWDWYAGWDADHTYLNSITNDLLRHRTTYILMDAERLSQFSDPGAAAIWRMFVQTHYEPLTIPGANRPILWKRAEAAIPPN